MKPHIGIHKAGETPSHVWVHENDLFDEWHMNEHLSFNKHITILFGENVLIIIIASSYIALFRTEGPLKALYRYIYIITPVIGFRLTRTQCMHILHSLGSIPARRLFYKRTRANLTTLAFASYRVPIYTWVESGKCVLHSTHELEY